MFLVGAWWAPVFFALLPRHSPLAGIFCFWSWGVREARAHSPLRHSPLAGIFCFWSDRDKRGKSPSFVSSQSPGGDFLFLVCEETLSSQDLLSCHSPLAGIFCFWSGGSTTKVYALYFKSQSPGGDFLFLVWPVGVEVVAVDAGHSPLAGIFCFWSAIWDDLSWFTTPVTVPWRGFFVSGRTRSTRLR